MTVSHKLLKVSGVTLTMFTIRRPPAEIFGAPTKYKKFTVSKKKEKKGRYYLFGFSYRLFAPLLSFWRPMKLYVPQIFFPHHRTLIWPKYGTFSSQINLIRNFGAPFSWRPRPHRGNRGYVMPLLKVTSFLMPWH